MKKLFVILFVLLCCMTAACAEVVGVTPEGKYIVAYQADNGQMLYCISCVPEPVVERQDVNFDGQEDIVFSINGETLKLYEFFVWDGAQYVLAMHPCTNDYSLKGPVCNYALYPEYGLVYAYVNIGENGNHFIKYLMRWEGTDLALLRRAEGKFYSDYDEKDGAHIVRQYWDQVQIDVRDYTQDPWGSVLYSRILSLNEMNDEAHKQVDEALWQGVK